MKTTEVKIQYLTKLMDKLLLFSKYFNNVSVSHVGEYIIVQWNHPKNKDKDTILFDEKEIPVGDIDTAIEHYRGKLRYRFNKRNK